MPSSLIYNAALDSVVRGDIDFDDDQFKVIFVTNSYVPDKDTHVHRSDVAGEVTPSGSYVAGGLSAVVDVVSDSINNRTDITLGAVEATNATITASGAVYYKDTGNAASDPLVAYIDFGLDVISTAGKFSLTASTLRLQN